MLARRAGVAILVAGAVVAAITQLPGLGQLPSSIARRQPGVDRRRARAGDRLHAQLRPRLPRRLRPPDPPAREHGNRAGHAGDEHPAARRRLGWSRRRRRDDGPRRRAARLPASRTVALFLVTSLVSFAAIAAAGLGVATGLLDGEATLVATLVPAVVALLVIAAVIALPRVVPRPAGNAAAAGRIRRALVAAAAHAHDGVDAGSALLRGKEPLVVWGSLGYFAFDVAALAAAFHAIGAGGLPIGLLVLAYTLGHAGSIVPLPGSTEGGLVAAFVLYGAALAPAAAAVLAYRALHAGVPTLLGVIGLADARRQISRGRVLVP